MKRGSRKPEKASTRPPAKARSSFPQRDPRPPKRGKSGSPLATGAAKAKAPASGAPTGTSQSGKPIKPPLDASTVASTETPRGKTAGPTAIAEPATKPRKLNAREIEERKNRFNDAYGRKRMLEREKKIVSADLSREIKKLGKECDELHDEIKRGRELLRQGELPLEDPETAAGATTPSVPTAAADDMLRKVAAHTPKNGGAFDIPENEPAPKIDPNQAGPTRIEASRAEDDITRAAKADAAGAHA